MAPPTNSVSAYYPTAMTLEEEDTLVHTRITNDERPLRRVTKKFHTYTSVAYPPLVPPPPSTTTSVEEARELFLLELAGFQLLLNKSMMACDAETRQAQEYQNEKRRISEEHLALRDQIEQLKEGLEQAQLERRRKIEYDQIAEKINTLPSREELEASVSALENDIQIIQSEHEITNKFLLAKKAGLDAILGELNALRLMGKDGEADASGDVEMEGSENAVAEGDKGGDDTGGAQSMRGSPAPSSSSALLNPDAKPFHPRSSGSGSLLQTATHQLRLRNASAPPTRPGTPLPMSPAPSSHMKDNDRKEDGEEDEDIEMGEVSERETKGRISREEREDREEGEASDDSSSLSEPSEG